MKITDVKVYLAKEWRSFCFVVIDTDEGISGIGESGMTGRELAVKGAIEHFQAPAHRARSPSAPSTFGNCSSAADSSRRSAS